MCLMESLLLPFYCQSISDSLHLGLPIVSDNKVHCVQKYTDQSYL